jgi:Bacterial PH domain
VIIRVSRSSYLLVGFLVVGFAPIALYGGADHPTEATISALTGLYLIPVLIAFFIARTATIVASDGILVRALFGHRVLTWDTIRGLSVSGRSIYAVLIDGGAVRLPCARITDLAAISAASAGRLPEIPEAKVIPAPSGRRR